MYVSTLECEYIDDIIDKGGIFSVFTHTHTHTHECAESDCINFTFVWPNLLTHALIRYIFRFVYDFLLLLMHRLLQFIIRSYGESISYCNDSGINNNKQTGMYDNHCTTPTTIAPTQNRIAIFPVRCVTAAAGCINVIDRATALPKHWIDDEVGIDNSNDGEPPDSPNRYIIH